MKLDICQSIYITNTFSATTTYLLQEPIFFAVCTYLNQKFAGLSKLPYPLFSRYLCNIATKCYICEIYNIINSYGLKKRDSKLYYIIFNLKCCFSCRLFCILRLADESGTFLDNLPSAQIAKCVFLCDAVK